jgi:hypothetical protein
MSQRRLDSSGHVLLHRAGDKSGQLARERTVGTEDVGARRRNIACVLHQVFVDRGYE